MLNVDQDGEDGGTLGFQQLSTKCTRWNILYNHGTYMHNFKFATNTLL